MSRRLPLWLLGASCLLWMPAVSAAEDESSGPARFRDLLAPGDAVYLQSTADNPLYSLQLLTPEQAETVQAENAEIAELREQIAAVNQKLTMEQRLEQRATLMLELEELELDVNIRVSRTRSYGAYYQVTRVGEDYVALKQDERETFVPFASIRTMYRGDPLRTMRPSFNIDRGRGAPFVSRGFGRGRDDDTSRTTFEVRLRFITAEDMAAALGKIFADENLVIEPNATTNSLVISATEPQASSVRRLIERLDTNPE